MKRKRYEILKDGTPTAFGRRFGSLLAARSFVTRQLRPRSKSGRGWRVLFISREPGHVYTIRDIKRGCEYPATPPNEADQ